MAREKSPAWGVKILMLAVSLALGYFVSRALEDRPKPPETETDPVEVVEAHEPPPPEEPIRPPEPPPVEELPKTGLEQVDYALKSEEYERALELAHEKQADASKELLPRFRYREALALEAAGDYAHAAPIYREVAETLDDRASWLRVRLRAGCCLARSDKIEEARRQFAELHRIASEDEHGDVAFFQELYLAVALMEVRSLIPLSTPACDDPKLLSVPAPPFPVKRWIAWADGLEELPYSSETDPALPTFPARDSLQAIRDALEVGPLHPQAPYVRLALGCLYAQRGQRLSSIQEFTRLLVRHPHEEIAIHAAYNRGVLEIQESEFASAKLSFLEVVDRSTQSSWKGLGWWWVGRSRMDSGNVNEAVAPLEEAIHYGKGTPVERFAVMALAAVHLERGESREAHRCLDPHRRGLREQPYRPFAAFLDARARLTIALNQGRTAVGAERDDLLETVLQFPSETPLGPLMHWLVGESATEMGLGSIARPRFETASKNLRGSLAVRMIYRVAEEDARMGRTHDAKVTFAAAAIDPGEWGIRARLQLGEIALREERPQQALQRAMEVYQQSPDSKEAALLLMGKAYYRLGDAPRAAMCFGGEIPSE